MPQRVSTSPPQTERIDRMSGHRLPKLDALLVGAVVLAVNGCGPVTVERTIFPSQMVDAEDNPLYIEDLQAITQDPDLTPDEMIGALRRLGIENEEFIQAIVDDGFGD